MSEVIEEKESEQPDVQRYVDIVRRRHFQFLIPVFLGWLIVWGASWILPARYKSSTLILVEQPTMPKNYVEQNVTDNLQDRLQSITQQILSRTRLLLIIDKQQLYAERHSPLTPDEKVERMRKDIDIKLVRDAQDAITAFNIYYSAHDPVVAQRVTSELTDLFINESSKVRLQQSEETTKFMKDQLESASASLAVQEAKVREFKGQHEGELPSQQTTNLQILTGLQTQLQSDQNALNTAKTQRVYYQTLIEQYRTLHGTSQTSDGTPTSLSAIDKELSTLKAKLADLSSHYTDRYPDVQNLKSEIAKTEKMREALIAETKPKANVDRQDDDSASALNLADPSQNSAVLQLQSQLQANQVEIANREQGIADLKARINSYQARLNNEPASEQKLADLTRGYDQSRVNFDDLLKKKNESEMATSMEQMQQGERFSILDPPSFPMKPDFPNRLKFCGIGLAVGLALGVIVVGGLEYMDDRLHSEKQIKALLPMTIISEIPEILNLSDERSNKKQIALGWAMAALVVVTILSGTAFSYLHN